MNILYKYCNILGVIRILALLELKLPFISEVNDPLECSPIYLCGNDRAKAEALCLKAFKSNNIPIPINIKELLTDDIKQKLVDSQKQLQEDWRRSRGCLLSVSMNERNPVAWSHYTENHKGAVIGFDFNTILDERMGIGVDPVIYSEHRPKIDILESDDLIQSYRKTLMTKSSTWAYEEEFRTIFFVKGTRSDSMDLMTLKLKGLAAFKDFNGKGAWFLRINPVSIKKVIFGLHMDEDLKLIIRKLIVGSQLNDVKLYQVAESDNYEFDLIEL